MSENIIFKNPIKTIMAFCAFTVGLVATISQILILRETVATYGNQEIFYGLTLTFWLFYIGVGSRLVKRFEKYDTLSLFLVVQLLTIPFLFGTIFLIRTLKTYFGLVSGSMISPLHIAAFSFFTLFPLCLLLGLQFSLISKLFADKSKNLYVPLNEAYLSESIGAVGGAFLFNFLLIFLLKPFQILALLSLLLWLSITCAVCYLVPVQDTKNRKFWGTFALIVLFFMNLLFISPVSSDLEKWSLKRSWQGFRVLRSLESPYGRITFTQNKRELTAYRNSELLFSTTAKLLHEEKAHIPLLSAPMPPTNVLLIGGGLGGTLEEFLKYTSLKSIDYLELDRTLLRQSREYLTRFNFFRDKRVQILSKDARQYLKNVSKNYDVIISGVDSPDSIMLNRFFSEEFFKLCKKRLAPEGIMAITMPHSESYMGPEMTQLNQMIGKTFQKVFPRTMIWPGTYNYFIGRGSETGRLSHNSWSLVARMNERGIRNSYLTPQALVSLLTPEKVDTAQQLLTENPFPINRDMRPYAYFFQQILWSTYLRSPLKYLFSELTSSLIYGSFALLMILLIAYRLLTRKKANLVPLAIFSLGASAMVVQISNIYLFQVLAGSLYYQLGILILFFMLGITFGSYQTKKSTKKASPAKNILPQELALLLIPALCLLGISFGTVSMLDNWAYLMIFPLLSFLTGYPVGRNFGLGAQLQQAHTDSPGFLAALIYSADIWGGALTALLTTALLLPILGFHGTLGIAIGFVLAAIVLAK